MNYKLPGAMYIGLFLAANEALQMMEVSDEGWIMPVVLFVFAAVAKALQEARSDEPTPEQPGPELDALGPFVGSRSATPASKRPGYWVRVLLG
jgi:hypothetical protein